MKPPSLHHNLAATGGNRAPKCFAMFDGKSLAGWRATSEANWRIEDGAIVVDSGEPGLIAQLNEGEVAFLHLHIRRLP